jgi:2-dehydro-3-deoxyphosphogluconate aldolase/(4S)-4-hydroxy-2-oxoglutarate aldolase
MALNAHPQARFTALQVMQDASVIPVIVLNDVAHAVPMARALVAGGIRMLEVTLRTPQALACMEAIAKAVPDAVVGAGTVRTAADAKAAANAGAKFAVSPGYTSAVGQACRDQGLSLLPGVATGSEIMMAQEDGYTDLKFFPAMEAGGTAMLKAWSGPFFDVRLCPTGGVTS